MSIESSPKEGCKPSTVSPCIYIYIPMIFMTLRFWTLGNSFFSFGPWTGTSCILRSFMQNRVSFCHCSMTPSDTKSWTCPWSQKKHHLAKHQFVNFCVRLYLVIWETVLLGELWLFWHILTGWSSKLWWRLYWNNSIWIDGSWLFYSLNSHLRVL